MLARLHPQPSVSFSEALYTVREFQCSRGKYKPSEMKKKKKGHNGIRQETLARDDPRQSRKKSIVGVAQVGPNKVTFSCGHLLLSNFKPGKEIRWFNLI